MDAAAAPWRTPSRFGVGAALYVGVLAFAPSVAAFVAPVPVAVYAARRLPIQVLILVGMTITVELVRVWRLDAVATGGVGALTGSALVGLPIGWALRRHWTYNRIVAMATAIMAILHGLLLWIQWDVVEAVMAKTVESLQRPDANQPAELVNNAPKFLEHAAELVFGIAAFSMLVTVCLVTSIAARWLTVRDRYRLRGSFRELRQPDWLVWVVIAAFVIGFAEYHWPQPVLRWLSWNAGVMLAGTYWTTGIALGAYAVWSFRLPLWLVFLALVFLMLPFAIGIPFAAGLMDTWGEYRLKMDRWVAARQGDDTTGRSE